MVKFTENAATVGNLRTFVRALGRMNVPNEAPVAYRRLAGELHLEVDFDHEAEDDPGDENEED